MPAIRVQENTQSYINSISDEIQKETESKFSDIDKHFTTIKEQINKNSRDTNAMYNDLLQRYYSLQKRFEKARTFLIVMNAISLVLIIFLLIRG